MTPKIIYTNKYIDKLTRLLYMFPQFLLDYYLKVYGIKINKIYFENVILNIHYKTRWGTIPNAYLYDIQDHHTLQSHYERYKMILDDYNAFINMIHESQDVAYSQRLNNFLPEIEKHYKLYKLKTMCNDLVNSKNTEQLFQRQTEKTFGT